MILSFCFRNVTLVLINDILNDTLALHVNRKGDREVKGKGF